MSSIRLHLPGGEKSPTELLSVNHALSKAYSGADTWQETALNLTLQKL
jgi:hypothetical protein